MFYPRHKPRHAAATLMLAGLLLCMAGCRTFDFYSQTLLSPMPSDMNPPRELSMVSLPAYRVDAPDVLQIEVFKLVPRPPYRIESYDLLLIRVIGTTPDAPINDYYLVDAEGAVDLGPMYGKLRISGMTLDEASSILTQYLKQMLSQPEASVQLIQTSATQQVTGTYLIQQDGIVNLRQYGAVNVAGKTLAEVQTALEKHLANYFDSPKVVVEVVGYNSEKYYVIRENSIEGEDVIDLSVTGNETVLDAIGKVGGLTRASSQRVWIARPVPGKIGCEQILPVDYMAITRDASSATNYQILPGDRIFVAQDPVVAFGVFVNNAVSPVYQMLSMANLGGGMVKTYQFMGRRFNSQRFF
jgi:polysaccharide biosynthesis/export protein